MSTRLLAVLFAGGGLTAAAHAGEVLSLGDLATIAQARDAGVDALMVSYTFQVVSAPDTLTLGDVDRQMVLSGSNAFTRAVSEIRKGGEAVGVTAVEHAWDGHSTVHHIQNRGAATRLDEFRMSLDSSAFMQFMLLGLPDAHPGLYTAPTLVDYLQNDFAALRPELEVIEGRACHVVDLTPPEGDSPIITLWIDAERQCLPMLQHHFSSHDGSLMFSLETLEAAEVDGVWIPVAGYKRTSPVENSDDLHGLYEWFMGVQLDEAGAPAAAFNVDDAVAAPFFDLEPNLPIGTLLTIVENGALASEYTVATGPLDRLRDSIAIVGAGSPLSTAYRDQPSTPAAAVRLVSGAAAAGVSSRTCEACGPAATKRAWLFGLAGLALLGAAGAGLPWTRLRG